MKPYFALCSDPNHAIAWAQAQATIDRLTAERDSLSLMTIYHENVRLRHALASSQATIAQQAQRLADLEASTRRLVDAATRCLHNTGYLFGSGYRDDLIQVLADPILVSLRRRT